MCANRTLAEATGTVIMVASFTAEWGERIKAQATTDHTMPA
jgi:hypothetical protein